MNKTIELLSGKNVPCFADLTNTGKKCSLGNYYADSKGNYYVASGYQAYKFNPKVVKPKEFERYFNFVLGGVPRYLRVYDNGGKTADRYTVVFAKTGKGFYVGFNETPFHPAFGIYQHGESSKRLGGKTYYDFIDRPTYAHLGKKIKFSDLNEDCKKAVMQDYLEIFNLPALIEK